MSYIIQDAALNLKINLGSTISKNGIINLIKGDTLEFKFDLNIGTPIKPVIVELGENDFVSFRVMYPNDNWNNAIIDKTVTKDDLDEDGNVVIEFESSDTEFINAGLYYYQVKLFIARQDKEDIVITLIPKTRIYIQN